MINTVPLPITLAGMGGGGGGGGGGRHHDQYSSIQFHFPLH